MMKFLKRLLRINELPVPDTVEAGDKFTRNVQSTTRELLRQSLNAVSIDFFAPDDPLLSMTEVERQQYLQAMHVIYTEGHLVKTIDHMINRQVRLMIGNSKNAEFDQLGAMNINGMGTVKDKLKELSVKYQKDYMVDRDTFNKRGI